VASESREQNRSIGEDFLSASELQKVSRVVRSSSVSRRLPGWIVLKRVSFWKLCNPPGSTSAGWQESGSLRPAGLFGPCDGPVFQTGKESFQVTETGHRFVYAMTQPSR
jgi:hypothetical protein